MDVIILEIYVYLDESGSIHKNSNTRYFAIAGYFTFKSSKNKITSLYKKIDKETKDLRNMDLKKELKSRNMKENEKIKFIKNIQNIENFYGIAKVFDKSLMRKEIVESNIFFNYAVKVLLKDTLIPLLNLQKVSNITFILSIDNRNLRVGDLRNLENYLNMEFCKYKFRFSVTYYDSATNFGVQLADLIVNTFYMYFKDKTIIKNVIPIINFKKFRVSLFPGYYRLGRIKKISYFNNI